MFASGATSTAKDFSAFSFEEKTSMVALKMPCNSTSFHFGNSRWHPLLNNMALTTAAESLRAVFDSTCMGDGDGRIY